MAKIAFIGAGSLVFCQWDLPAHLDRPVARLLFVRLLSL